MRVLCVHAHFDDFEFTCAGLFALWRRKLGERLKAKVIVCTDGQAGHHFRTREETGRIRLEEQRASARIGGYAFEPLRLPDGSLPREGCVQADPPVLAALWRAIRDFQPDYLFCPPLAADPLAGIHPDHVAVADAVRRVAYMINVPHAFTPEYPADETRSEACAVPVIVNLYDGYMPGANPFDLAVDVSAVFDEICAMTYCHQSQICEWLPWVGRHEVSRPESIEDWKQTLRRRFERQADELGLPRDRPHEVFTLTRWGSAPSLERVISDFPQLISDVERLERARRRLRV